MCDHMANSKAYVSFVLLITVLLSSHILTHELPEGGIGTKRDQYTTHLLGNGKGGTGAKEDIYTPRLLGNGIGGIGAETDQYTSQLLGNGIGGTSAKRNQYRSRLLENGKGEIGAERNQYTPHLLGNRIGGTAIEKDQHTPRLLDNGIGGTGADRDQYVHSVDFKPSGLEDIEPKNYEDGTVMSHRKMMRPSEIDWKSFHESQAKTSWMTHGSKSGYDGVPKMEEVGEGIMN